MDELVAAGGERCANDQILYNLTRRGPEHALLPWLAERRMPVMAYSPVEQGRLIRNEALAAIAYDVGATPAQLALAWLLSRESLIAIPKAGSIAHTIENCAASYLKLDTTTLKRLDDAFPAPTKRTALEML